MLIMVTQQHIDDGVPSKPQNCPVANALKEHFPGCTVKVIHSICFISNQLYHLPSEVPEKIYQFDQTKEMTPFEFELCLSKSAS